MANTPSPEAPLPEARGLGRYHRWIEERSTAMILAVTVLITIGGLVEIIPMIAVKTNIPSIAEVKPYTALEVEGRDIYVREGCYNCHSQQIRPFRAETLRYGDYSRSGEFVYDRPFQWGSKRTGPDLARVGGKYNDAWHYRHMEDPQTTSPGSIMPRYPWLLSRKLDDSYTSGKLGILRDLGAPYTDAQVAYAPYDLAKQAKTIADNLASTGIEVTPDREIVAVIAYLQRLGTDWKAHVKAAQDGSADAADPAPTEVGPIEETRP